jgi:hypothetical protein
MQEGWRCWQSQLPHKSGCMHVRCKRLLDCMARAALPWRLISSYVVAAGPAPPSPPRGLRLSAVGAPPQRAAAGAAGAVCT